MVLQRGPRFSRSRNLSQAQISICNAIRLPGCSNCSTRPCPPHSLAKSPSRSIAPRCFDLLFAFFWASRGNQLSTLGKWWKVGKTTKKKIIPLQYSLYSSSLAITGIVKHRVQHFALRGWTSGEIITMQLPCDHFYSQGYLG